MSEISEQQTNEQIRKVFQNVNLTGYSIAKNNEVTEIVKRDSTDFTNQLLKHKRGRQIVCQLMGIVLRPDTLQQFTHQQTGFQTQENINPKLNSNSQKNTVYNALQILTNQYQQFVQFVFNQQSSTTKQEIKNAPSFTCQQQAFQPQSSKLNKSQDQQWDDCVIMDSQLPQLTRNQQDQILKKINQTGKLDYRQNYQCKILNRMFMIFQEHVKLDQTPVSYFNKIFQQFVYQKPNQLIRFFYCNKQSNTSTNNKNNNNNIYNNNQIQPNNNIINTINTQYNKNKTQTQIETCPRIRLISNHLYNISVVQTLLHILELQSQGNFYIEQKIQILRIVNEQIFKKSTKTQQSLGKLQQDCSTASDINEQKIQNYILLLKQLYEKLQDRYQQQKYLPILRRHFNDQSLLTYIFTYLDKQKVQSQLVMSLICQIIKLDQVNYRLSKTPQKETQTKTNNFGFNNKNQESAIMNYDLKLNISILEQISNIIQQITTHFNKVQIRTMKIVMYFETIYYWLNIVLKGQEKSLRQNCSIISPQFINQCLTIFCSHPNSTILHNIIKQILLDFIPLLSNGLKLILSSQCYLLSFLQKQLGQSLDKLLKKKCYHNQLYHLGKMAVNLWQQQKDINSQGPNQCQNQQLQLEQSQGITHQNQLLFNYQNISKFQNIKAMIQKKKQFYDHLICGDPRSMGQYQQQQSTQVVMVSSFKNFLKSSNPIQAQKIQQQAKQPSPISLSSLKQPQFIMQVPGAKNSRYQNLNLQPTQSSQPNLIFQSVISPMNANRSHTFNFDFQLPLDSDHSDQVDSEDDQGRKDSQGNQDQVNKMTDNLENVNILRTKQQSFNFNSLQNNKEHSNHGFLSNTHGLLGSDLYRKEQLSKSVDIPDFNDSNIQKVDSYMVIDSRKQSEDDLFSLGINSNKGSQIDKSNKGSQIEKLTSSAGAQIFKDAVDETQDLDSNFVRLYSSYLSYNADDLMQDI